MPPGFVCTYTIKLAQAHETGSKSWLTETVVKKLKDKVEVKNEILEANLFWFSRGENNDIA